MVSPSPFAFQSMLYIILYLQSRYSRGRDPIKTFLVPFCQTAAAVWAAYVGLSRVSDYKHNPGDVLAGTVLGAAVQVLNVFFVMKLFTRQEGDSDKQFSDEKRNQQKGPSSNPLLCFASPSKILLSRD